MRTPSKSKAKTVLYWISTVWLALGMVSTGIGQLLRMEVGQGAAQSMVHLGYPAYLLTLLGVWKVLGSVAVLIPKTPLLKEWAYAGFFFAMSGAAVSHIAVGDSVIDVLPSVFLLLLTVVSWASRPAGRKIPSAVR